METVYAIYYYYIFIDNDKDDYLAFIFSLKNPHNVPPTKFMNKTGSKHVIACEPDYGPVFGNVEKDGSDIFIGNNCNEMKSCSTRNNGTNGYECHPEYKSSLFVNTAEPNNTNFFAVLEYEVYSIDYENKEYIYNTCKYPDIIWNYIETKEISEELIENVDNDTDLFNDLNIVKCNNIAIRLKISKYCLKNPSQFLPNTQIIDQQYDSYLIKWIGNKQTELLYRASEHNYTFESFHKSCDDYDHLLVIIKNNGGWIFGGYTSMSWKVNNPNDKGCILYIFF